MDAGSKALRQRLKEAGFSDPLIEAVWPSWWSDDASNSLSSKAELRFSVARKLGLSAESLFHDNVEFAWEDAARFKGLSTESEVEKSILTSYGISVARALLHSYEDERLPNLIEADELRSSLLVKRQFIDLTSLLAACWSFGIPVIHLRVFPLPAKRMHAMAVRVGDRYAILLGRDAKYPAPVMFTLAHELGHIMLGHLADGSAIIDIDEILAADSGDDEENAANEYALSVLVGSTSPKIETNVADFNAAQLAEAALREGPQTKVEPGTLALCLAHMTGKWAIAQAALDFIYTNQSPVWEYVNRVAESQLEWEKGSSDATDYLAKVLGLADDE